MSTIMTKDGVEIFYKDWGRGQPIVFHHGWPLSSDDWDAQMMFFVHQGYRVVGIDRRGHGRSSQVSDGHDMDHYAADAAASSSTWICAAPSTLAIQRAAVKSPATLRDMEGDGSLKRCWYPPYHRSW